MSLINCPDCQKEVRSHAKTCPNCGRPIKGFKQTYRPKNYTPDELKKIKKSRRRTLIIAILSLPILFYGGAWLTLSTEDFYYFNVGLTALFEKLINIFR